MSTRRVILRNVVSNWTGYAVNVVVALFLSPFVVHTLGDDLYGLWTLIIAFTGYYGVLDLGIRSAVGQYVTRYWAQGDMPGVNRTMNTAVVLMSGAAVLAIAASVVISLGFPSWFSIQGEEPWRLQWSIVIMGIGIALNFPLAVYGSATVATQRYDLSNLIAIADRLVSAGLIVWVLGAGYGLLGLSIVATAATLLGAAARVLVAFRLLPGLVFSPRAFAKSSLVEIGHYGFFSFLIRISGQVIDCTGALIIGAFMNVEAVTYFAIGANLIPYFKSIIRGMVWPLTPVATSADATGDLEALRRLLIHGTRGTFLVAAFIGGGLLFLGHDFLRLWMGEKYVSGEVYTSSAVILSILSVSAMMQMMQSCGLQVLFGMRQVRFLAVLSGCEAVGNLGLSLVLVRRFGLAGVAVGTLVPAIVTQGVIQTLFLLRRLGIPLRKYLAHVPWGGLAALAAMGLTWWPVSRYLTVDNWPAFILKATMVSVPAVAAGFIVGTTRDEKRSLGRRLVSIARTAGCNRSRPGG